MGYIGTFILGMMCGSFLGILFVALCVANRREEHFGRWIWNEKNGCYQCSSCGHFALHEDARCPICNAIMSSDLGEETED